MLPFCAKRELFFMLQIIFYKLIKNFTFVLDKLLVI